MIASAHVRLIKSYARLKAAQAQLIEEYLHTIIRAIFVFGFVNVTNLFYSIRNSILPETPNPQPLDKPVGLTQIVREVAEPELPPPPDGCLPADRLGVEHDICHPETCFHAAVGNFRDNGTAAERERATSCAILRMNIAKLLAEHGISVTDLATASNQDLIDILRENNVDISALHGIERSFFSSPNQRI